MEQGTGPRSFQRNRPYCTFKRGLSPQGGQLSLHHTVGHLSPQHLVILVLAGDVAEGTWISIGFACTQKLRHLDVIHQRFHVRRGAAHAAYPERGQPHQHLQSHWPSRPHGRRYHLRQKGCDRGHPCHILYAICHTAHLRHEDDERLTASMSGTWYLTHGF